MVSQLDLNKAAMNTQSFRYPNAFSNYVILKWGTLKFLKLTTLVGKSLL